jgi:hypothetical protein
MGGSRNTQRSNSTQQTAAYAPAQAGIDASIGGVTNWMNDPGSQEVYGGPRAVGPSAMTQQGLAAYGNTANTQASADYLRGVIGGENFNPNMDRLTEAVRASVMPGLNASFSANGMGSSSMHQGVLARELGRATAPHLFGAYESDQGRRLQAASMLPDVDERIGQRQIEAGQIGEGYERERIGAERDLFDETQMAGLRPYATGMGLLGGIGQQFGTTRGHSRQTTTTTPSLGQTIGGAAMMGLGAMSGNPAAAMGGMGAMFSGGRSAGGMMGPSYAPGLPWGRY